MEYEKRPLPEDPSPVTPHNEESKPTHVYSRSEYPNIKYWTKKEWLDAQSAKKKSSKPADQPGTRGRKRISQGENVSAHYLEDEDGTPVNGMDVSKIREYARSIWIEFETRGVAPKKWSQMPRNVKDEYVSDMEKQWPILRYCDDHWKANQVASSTYSQWYGYHHISSDDDNSETKGPSQKRRKVDDDNTSDRDANSGTGDTDPRAYASDLDANINIASPSWLEEGIHDERTTGPRPSTQRPKARPVLRDPLYVLKFFTDVANDLRSSF
jgi:hypothetical protein